MTGLALRSAAKSDIGLLRSGNEDSAYAGPNLLVVADGMGGHAAGEVASAAVVARFALLDELELSPAEALAALSATAEEANDTVLELMTADEELGDRIALVHVGDSRAYLLRDGELSQLTHDHTYVQTLVDAGRITADEAVVHPRRNLLMRAIDGSPPVEADLSIREARLGDRYLLCSDGLSGVLPESDLAEVLCLGDPTGAVTALVERALAAGAPDNVTCVVADVVEKVDVIEAPGVVVGAAAEARVRRQLPGIAFPADVEPAAEPEDPARVAAEAPAKRTARHRWRLTALLVAAVTLGVVLTMTAVTVWGQSQYFVGQQNDMVAIYRGIPQGILGVQLSSLVQQTNIPVTSLPSYDRLQLGETIAAKSLDDARGIVAHLRLDSASAG
jgi:serine/threonine protein phosphatase PrpC